MIYRLIRYLCQDRYARWYCGGILLFAPLFASIVISNLHSSNEARWLLPNEVLDVIDLLAPPTFKRSWLIFVAICSTTAACVVLGTLVASIVTRSRQKRLIH